MIKLQPPPKPKELTDEFVKKKTNEFKLDNKLNVWNEDFIKEALLAFSHNKCVYTECKFIESNYMEIDHFYPKGLYPDEVLIWENLLPVCKKVNTTKKLDTKNEPFINPTKDDPKEHLYIKHFRFYSKTDKGQNTIDYTGINDRIRFVDKRYKIGMALIEELDDIYTDINDNLKKEKKVKGTITRIINRYKRLLSKINREEEYSATLATVALENDENQKIMNILKQNNYWDDELGEYIAELEFCALKP